MAVSLELRPSANILDLGLGGLTSSSFIFDFTIQIYVITVNVQQGD